MQALLFFPASPPERPRELAHRLIVIIWTICDSTEADLNLAAIGDVICNFKGIFSVSFSLPPNLIQTDPRL